MTDGRVAVVTGGVQGRAMGPHCGKKVPVPPASACSGLNIHTTISIPTRAAPVRLASAAIRGNEKPPW